MNKNQIKTLALYALNYSYTEIGHILNISVNTIKWRLKTVRRKYPEYWDNARSVRASYKRCKWGIVEARSIEDIPGHKIGIEVAEKIPAIDRVDLQRLDLAIDYMLIDGLLSKMSRTK